MWTRGYREGRGMEAGMGVTASWLVALFAVLKKESFGNRGTGCTAAV